MWVNLAPVKKISFDTSALKEVHQRTECELFAWASTGTGKR